MKRRPGYSLIECLVMITLISITLSTVVMTLNSMNRAERRMRADVEHSETMSRFASQFRADTHGATSAKFAGPANDGQTLQLAFTDGKAIEYKLSDRGVDRTVRLQDAIQHRDSYTMRMASGTRWEMETDKQRPLISLQVPILSGNDPKGLTPATCRIQAAMLGASRPMKGEQPR